MVLSLKQGRLHQLFERNLHKGFLSNEYQPLEVREFVLVSVFPLIEKICPKIWAKLQPNNAKRSTSGGCASTAPQKRLFA